MALRLRAGRSHEQHGRHQPSKPASFCSSHVSPLFHAARRVHFCPALQPLYFLGVGATEVRPRPGTDFWTAGCNRALPLTSVMPGSVLHRSQ